MTNSNVPNAATSRRKSQQRKASADRWSAKSTIEWIGTGGTALGRTPTVEDAPTGAIKAKVHYRFEGSSKKPTFAEGGDVSLTEQVHAFQALLAAAYLNDWPADAKAQPVKPYDLSTITAPADEHARAESGWALPTVADAGPVDVESIAAWYKDRQRNGRKKQGGEKRSENTTADYADHVDFFLEFARYAEDDPRHIALGLPVGAPMRVGEPVNGVSHIDLLNYVAMRAATDLRIRKSNSRKIANWAADLEKEERNAARDGREPVLPPMPELRPEFASARTIEAHARTIKAMFHDAFAHGRISYQPWTAAVDDEVPNADTTNFTTRVVPNRDQVDLIVDTIRNEWRMVKGPDHKCFKGNGKRYAAMVWLAGHYGLRPEESIAIRDSWVILDDGDPRIELRGAEIYVSHDGERGRDRICVPLKHRDRDAIRFIRPDSDLKQSREEFVRVLSEHRAEFGTSADSSAAGADEDPHFFTNHMEEAVELSNFGDWWHQTMDAVRAADSSRAFVDLPFRRLRAAAITDWLIHDCSTYEASVKAGNSQGMIDRHYAGVVEERPHSQHAATESAARAEITNSTVAAPQNLDDLKALVTRLSNEEFRALTAEVNREAVERLSLLG